MRKVMFALLMGGLIGLGGCFSPKIDLSGLDNLIKVKKDNGNDKKDKDEEKKKKDD